VLTTIGYVILCGFIVGVLAAVWTFVIGLGGVPGAFLAYLLRPSEKDYLRMRNFSLVGLIVCVAGQSYMALTFSALLISFTGGFLVDRPELIRWSVWVVTYCVSLLPVYFALRDAKRKDAKTTQDLATSYTQRVSLVGFWVFILIPSVMNFGWGWIPFVH